jgi:hypothetical protein
MEAQLAFAVAELDHCAVAADAAVEIPGMVLTLLLGPPG